MLLLASVVLAGRLGVVDSYMCPCLSEVGGQLGAVGGLGLNHQPYVYIYVPWCDFSMIALWLWDLVLRLVRMLHVLTLGDVPGALQRQRWCGGCNCSRSSREWWQRFCTPGALAELSRRPQIAYRCVAGDVGGFLLAHLGCCTCSGLYVGSVLVPESGEWRACIAAHVCNMM